jgi:beta-xylosidase
MGSDPNNTGTGEPILTFKKPDVGKTYPPAAPQTSDEFNSPALGLQWQWLANPRDNWFSLSDKPGSLRLFAQPANASLIHQPNLLLQKIPAPAISVVTKMEFAPTASGERAGLVIYGATCAWIGLVQTDHGYRVSQTVNRAGRGADTANESAGADISSNTVYLAFTLTTDSRAQFSYSTDGQSYTALGGPVTVAPVAGSWMGAKFGLFALADAAAVAGVVPSGHADFDWIHVAPFVP